MRSYPAVSAEAFPATWQVEGARVRRRFGFPDFASALAFVDRVGAVSERLDHHPDISFGWGYAEISCTTHATGGLTEADAALVAAIEQL